MAAVRHLIDLFGACLHHPRKVIDGFSLSLCKIWLELLFTPQNEGFGGILPTKREAVLTRPQKAYSSTKTPHNYKVQIIKIA